MTFNILKQMNKLFIFLVIFSFIIFSFQVLPLAYGQVGGLITISRPLGTYQADWYGIEITQLNQTMQIFMYHQIPNDDLALLLYEDDISEIYDPENNFLPIASGRNFFYSNTILVDFENIPPGYYTMAIVGFNIISGEQTTYNLESNLQLDFMGSTHLVDLFVDGLDNAYPTTVAWDFLGGSYTQTTSDNWFMWVDDSSTFRVNRTVQIDSTERFFVAEDPKWTIVQSETLNLQYFRQYYSSISTFGLNLPIDFSFTSGGQVIHTELIDSWGDWVDDGRSLVLPRLIDASPNERYITTDYGVVKVDKPVDQVIDYKHQWLVSINHNANVDIPVSVSFLGNVVHHNTADTLRLWIDDNSNVVVPSIVSSTPLQRWIVDSNSQFVSSHSEIEINYYEQVKPTIIINGLNVQYPTTITYTSQGQTHTDISSSHWSSWVDLLTPISLDSEISGQIGEKWTTSDNVIASISKPITFSTNYIHEFRVSMLFTDATKTTILSDLPTNVEIIYPDGKTSSITEYSQLWISDGTYTLKNVNYQGMSFTPLSSINFKPENGKSWIIPIGLYDLSFRVDDAFGYSVSNAQVLFTMPNGLKVLKQTDGHGQVTFNMIPEGEYNLEVSNFGLSNVYSGNVSSDSISTQNLSVLLSSFAILISVLLIIIVLSFSYWRSPNLRKTVKTNYKNFTKKTN